MFNNCIELIYYMLSKFWSFIFGSYLDTGISLGMILICAIIFSMLLRYVVAIPKAALPSTTYGRVKAQKENRNEKSAKGN